MFPEQIILIGVLINLICSLWYIRNILKGGTRPNPISWFIWSLAPFIGVYLQLKAGAGWSAMGVFMAGFVPLLVVIFSFLKRSAFWKIQPFDIFCGFISIFALMIYILTSNLPLSIIFAIASDFLAYLPTFYKSWQNPETETSSVYIGGIINNIFTLLIIKNWIFAVYSFPIYLILANLVEISFIYRKKIIS